MSTKSLLIRSATMVLSDRCVIGDLRVDDGKISGIYPGGDAPFSELDEVVIDAEGLHLLPGIIDPHVHFRDPGQPHKETLVSGSIAGATGGVTSFLDMPNNAPSIITMDLMNQKIATAKKSCITNFGFFMGATNDNVEELQKAVGTPQNPKSVDGVCGIKIFMASSTGDLLVYKEEPLRNIFANTGGLIAVHAEDELTLRNRWDDFKHRDDVAAHVEWRNDETALIATKRAVNLAEEYNHRLHVLHLTSALEANWLTGKTGKLVTTETLPQQLTFDQDDLEKIGTRLKMNPPLRYSEDRETLWKKLHDGTIQCIVTDHAPHTIESKNLSWSDAPSGMPGVETSLPVMLTHASEGKCTISDVVRWMSTNPAECYNIQNKGRLEIGYDADLVLVDMNNSHPVKDSNCWTKVGWNPFAGKELVGWPQVTIVSGKPVFERTRGDFDKGKILGNPAAVGSPLIM